MKNEELLEQTVLSDEAGIAPDGQEFSLNIVGVYQDVANRNWAMRICQRATHLAGEERVQSLWYNASSLRDTAVLLEAVRAALVADVIVVALYAADELPLDIYVWVQAWLPRRIERRGALAALVGVAEPMDSHSVRTFEYLRAVARKGQLDFISQERQRPVTSRSTSIKLIAERAGSARRVLQEF